MRKLLLINLLAFAGFFAVSETAASLLQSQQGQPLALVRLVERLRLRAAPLQQVMDACPVTTAWTPESPFHSDPLLGYWHRPNVSVASTIRLRRPIKREGIVGMVDRYTWQLSTGAHGERLSQPRSAPELSQGRPTVLLLGDSFIFGSGLPDSLSFGWQLQASLPDRRIVNYAGGGFGTIHQVLLLRDARSQGRLIPASLAQALRGGDVLLGYADFYQLRNVAAPSRLRTFQPRCGALQPPAGEAKSFTHPRANLHQGDLQIESVPLFQAHSGPDPSKAEQSAVTIALLDEALALVQELGARPTILWIRGNADSAPIQHLRRRGVPILDLRPPGKGLWTHDTLAPFDHHPGPLTANSWAREVAARLAQNPGWHPAADCCSASADSRGAQSHRGPGSVCGSPLVGSQARQGALSRTVVGTPCASASTTTITAGSGPRLLPS